MKLLALLYFVLSLFGIDAGGSTFVHRTVNDGVDVLYSKATVQAGVARFECLVSISGSCHYTVLPSHCAPGGSAPNGGCHTKPIEQFALATGDDRQITGLNDFHLCVSAEARPPEPGCQSPEPIAAH